MAEYRYEATGPAAANGWECGSNESAAGAWHALADIAKASDAEFAESLRQHDEVGTVEHDGTDYVVTRTA